MSYCLHMQVIQGVCVVAPVRHVFKNLTDRLPRINGGTMIYLIYSCFETPNRIAGSLLLDTAETEEEAQTKMQTYIERSAAYPILDTGVRHCYIKWDDVASPLQ